jgi:hypothetical protein
MIASVWLNSSRIFFKWSLWCIFNVKYFFTFFWKVVIPDLFVVLPINVSLFSRLLILWFD